MEILKKILSTIVVLIIAFFILYGAKKALGIDIFQNMSLWDFLEMLISRDFWKTLFS